jgi:hypothetical protein
MRPRGRPWRVRPRTADEANKCDDDDDDCIEASEGLHIVYRKKEKEKRQTK